VSVGLSLLLYVVLLSLVGPRLLTGRAATRLSPRLGVTAWFVTAWSTVSAAVLGGLALAVPELPHSLGEIVAACTHAYPHHEEAISATSVGAGALVLKAASGNGQGRSPRTPAPHHRLAPSPSP